MFLMLRQHFREQTQGDNTNVYAGVAWNGARRQIFLRCNPSSMRLARAPIHYFKIYTEYHKDKVTMTPTAIDLGVIICKRIDSFGGIVEKVQ